MRPDLLHRDKEGPSRAAPTATAGKRELNDELLAQAQAESHLRGLQHLVSVVQRLSSARNLESIMAIVRRAARELTHADGATFVMREGAECFYADEDAISPLWKGQRFPISACISGWSMLNRQSVIIEDIGSDPRVPQEAFHPTFVQSLLMIPIRTKDPVGALGVYWANPHKATAEEVSRLQSLADSTSIALETAATFASFEKRTAQHAAELSHRAVDLENLNRELEALSYSVAHDLRGPLITIDGFAQVLRETSSGALDEAALTHLGHIQTAAARMHRLIEDLLGLSRIARAPLNRTQVDLSAMADEIAKHLRYAEPDRAAQIHIEPGLTVDADPALLRTAVEHLLANAWKFSSKREITHIQLDTVHGAEGTAVYRIKDNGAGFDPRYATKLFSPFQRCHSQAEFPGTGIGLATVQRIMHRHGGKVWVDAQADHGASFYFTLSRA